MDTFCCRCILKVQSLFLSFRMKSITPLKTFIRERQREKINLQTVFLPFLNTGSIRYLKISTRMWKNLFFFPWRTPDGTNQLPGQTQDHHKKYTRMRKHRHWNASKFPYRMSFLRFCRCPNYSLLHFTKPALQHLWLGYKLRQLLTKHTTLLGPR